MTLASDHAFFCIPERYASRASSPGQMSLFDRSAAVKDEPRDHGKWTAGGASHPDVFGGEVPPKVKEEAGNSSSETRQVKEAGVESGSGETKPDRTTEGKKVETKLTVPDKPKLPGIEYDVPGRRSSDDEDEYVERAELARPAMIDSVRKWINGGAKTYTGHATKRELPITPERIASFLALDSANFWTGQGGKSPKDLFSHAMRLIDPDADADADLEAARRETKGKARQRLRKGVPDYMDIHHQETHRVQ